MSIVYASGDNIGFHDFVVTISSGSVNQWLDLSITARTSNYAVYSSYNREVIFSINPMFSGLMQIPGPKQFVPGTHLGAMTLQGSQSIKIDKAGSYTLTVRENMTGGYQTQVNFTVGDGISISAPTSGQVFAQSSGLVVQGSTTMPNTLIQVYLNDMMVGSSQTNPFGGFSVPITQTLTQGNHMIRVQLMTQDGAMLANSSLLPISVDIMPPDVTTSLVASGTVLDPGRHALIVTTNEGAQCKWAGVTFADPQTFGERFIVYQNAYPTTHTTFVSPIQGTNQYFVHCVDRNGHWTRTPVAVNKEATMVSPTIIHPTANQNKQAGLINFQRQHTPTFGEVGRYQIEIAKNIEFSNIVHVGTTTETNYQFALTDTGVYYRKLTTYDTKNVMLTPQITQFYLNNYLGGVIPDGIDLRLSGSTHLYDHFIPLDIRIRQRQITATDYRGTLVLEIEGLREGIDYDFFSGGLIPFDTDGGIQVLLQTLKIRKIGTFALHIFDKNHPSVSIKQNVTITDVDMVAFPHVYDAPLDSYVSSPRFRIPSSFHDAIVNVPIGCILYRNELDVGQSVKVLQGDRLKVSCRSAGRVGATKFYRIQFDNESLYFAITSREIRSRNSIFQSGVPPIADNLKSKLAILINGLFVNKKNDGITVSSYRNTLLAQTRELQSQYRSFANSNQVFYRNKATFMLNILAEMDKNIRAYNNTGVKENIPTFLMTFDMSPRFSTKIDGSRLLIVHNNQTLVTIQRAQGSRTLDTYVTLLEDETKKGIGKELRNGYTLSSYIRDKRLIGPYNGSYIGKVYKKGNEYIVLHTHLYLHKDSIYTISFDSVVKDIYESELTDLFATMKFN